MKAFIDIHHHILPYLDDGAQTMNAAYEMADAAVKDGIGIIVATPHTSPGVFPFPIEQYRDSLVKVNDYCKSRKYTLKILPGAEIKFTQATLRMLNEGMIPTLNNSRFILVEWHQTITMAEAEHAIRSLSNEGYKIILAHAERYKCFRKKNFLRELKEMYDVRVQVNCNTLLRRGIIAERVFAKQLLKNRVLDYIATDAHDIEHRKVNMHDAYQYICEKHGIDYANDVTRGNQQELLV